MSLRPLAQLEQSLRGVPLSRKAVIGSSFPKHCHHTMCVSSVDEKPQHRKMRKTIPTHAPCHRHNPNGTSEPQGKDDRPHNIWTSWKKTQSCIYLENLRDNSFLRNRDLPHEQQNAITVPEHVTLRSHVMNSLEHNIGASKRDCISCLFFTRNQPMISKRCSYTQRMETCQKERFSFVCWNVQVGSHCDKSGDSKSKSAMPVFIDSASTGMNLHDKVRFATRVVLVASRTAADNMKSLPKGLRGNTDG